MALLLCQSTANERGRKPGAADSLYSAASGRPRSPQVPLVSQIRRNEKKNSQRPIRCDCRENPRQTAPDLPGRQSYRLARNIPPVQAPVAPRRSMHLQRQCSLLLLPQQKTLDLPPAPCPAISPPGSRFAPANIPP